MKRKTRVPYLNGIKLPRVLMVVMKYLIQTRDIPHQVEYSQEKPFSGQRFNQHHKDKIFSYFCTQEKYAIKPKNDKTSQEKPFSEQRITYLNNIRKQVQ